MKIHVPSIPLEGLTLQFDQSTGWFAGIFTQRFSDIFPKHGEAFLQGNLQRTGQNVTFTSRVTASITPTCSRCGVEFPIKLDFPLLRNLAPYFPNPEGNLNQEEEIELSAEDLEFSFYHGEEIDLADIIAEEIELALPMRFLCSESCKGLCPSCGVNLNLQTCQCPPIETFSPFSVLKEMKGKP